MVNRSLRALRGHSAGVSPIQSPSGIRLPATAWQAHSSGNGTEKGFLVPWRHIDVPRQLIKAAVPRETPDRLQGGAVLRCSSCERSPETM